MCSTASAVTFGGPRADLPVPAGGKLVELEVLLSGRWQTFRTARTDAERALGDSLPVLPARAACSGIGSARICRRGGLSVRAGSSRSVRVRVRGR